MERKGLMGWLMAVSAVVLVCSALFFFIYEDDEYRYYTGIGSTLALSPDDSTFAFTYFEDGKESVFTADEDGKNVRRVKSDGGGEMLESHFSPDGKGIIYLKRDDSGTQSIYYKSDPEDNVSRLLSKRYLKVFTATYSPDGKQIYFVASPVDDGTLPKDITEGSDLYSVAMDGHKIERLTKNDIVPMSRLAVTADGKQIYYVGFGEEESLYIYDLEKKTHEQAQLQGEEVPYDPVFSPDGKSLAYTAVAETEDAEGLFEYEIFIKTTGKADARQVTHTGEHAIVPAFFNHENSIAYLQQTNWPEDPAAFQIRTVDLSSGYNELVQLEMPQIKERFHIDAFLNRIVTVPFLASVYTCFFLCWTIRLMDDGRKIFKPVMVSLFLTIAGLSAAGFMMWRDPFIMVDLRGLAVLFLAITVGIGILALILRAVGKRRIEFSENRQDSAI